MKGPLDQVIQRGAFTYRVLDRSKADLIIAVDGRKVRTLDDLLSYVESKKVGDKVTLRVIRDGKETGRAGDAGGAEQRMMPVKPRGGSRALHRSARCRSRLTESLFGDLAGDFRREDALRLLGRLLGRR